MKKHNQWLPAMPRVRHVISAALLFALLTPGSVAAAELVNLLTTEVGMHRITHQQLVDQGVDLSGARHRRLGLWLGDTSVAIRTKGQDKSQGRPSKFGPGGYIEFYAPAPDSLYSQSNAYTLHYGGQRLNIAKDRSSKYRKKNGAVTQYQQTQTVESNNYYDFQAPSKTDPWHYGQVFRVTAEDTAGTLVNFELDELAGNNAELEVQVYGLVDIKTPGNDHHFVAKLNGVEVGDQQFDGNVASTLSVSNVGVNAGNNQFQLYLRSIATTPFDMLGLNHITVRYSRNTVASGDYLEGYFDAPQALVSGFSDKTASVYRKQADGSVARLTRVSRQGSSIAFNTGGVAADYIVVAENGYKTPVASMLPEPEDIRSGQAEYLIITHAAFLGSELDQLVQLREADYSVKVVDVAQIYGQFGDYSPSADAIHDYIKFAAANLGTRFVALVGSDTYDYKQYVSQSVSYVPTRYEITPGGLLIIQQTPSDASYGDLDADGIPDIPIGRMTVRTKAELGIVVEKIVDYQARQGYAGRILIAADKEDFGNGVSFADDVADLIEATPADWSGAIRSDFRAIPDVDGDQAAHDKIIAAINAGVSVTAYIGHSSQQQWSRATPPLFSAAEIAGLTNIDKPTLVTQWGCWNTYFVDPGGNSMSDKFLVGGNNGAVTVLGASTLTTSAGERILGIELNQRMYNEGVTIGEAVIGAKQALALHDPDASDILLGWQIIGDPALVVNP